MQLDAAQATAEREEEEAELAKAAAAVARLTAPEMEGIPEATASQDAADEVRRLEQQIEALDEADVETDVSTIGTLQ